MELAVAGVSFAAAVAAVVVGQVLGGYLSRRADTAKWRHDDEIRRVERGERAAEAILQALFEADLTLFSSWKWSEGNVTIRFPAPKQAELEPLYVAIRRDAALIPNADVVKFLTRLARAIYGYDVVMRSARRTSAEMWFELLEAANRVLGAFLRGDPVPDEPLLESWDSELTAFYDLLESP